MSLFGVKWSGRTAHRWGSKTFSAPISRKDSTAGAAVMSFAKAKSTFTLQISPSTPFSEEWAAMMALASVLFI